MPTKHPPGPKPGKKYRVNVTAVDNKLRFTDGDGKDAETLEVRASGEKKFKSVVWHFDIPGFENAVIEFPDRSPFYDKLEGQYIEKVRAAGNKPIDLKIKSLDWAEDDARAIAKDEQFKYNVTVEAGEARFEEDPIVIVRENGDDDGEE